MKAVMLAVQPNGCEKIANGSKTIEVRKSAPECDVPFKCYIYCTKQTCAHALHLYINDGWGRQEIGITEHWRSGKEIVDVNSHLPAYRYNSFLAEGKVIGEFVCDKVDTYCYRDFGYEISEETFNKTMLTGDEFCGYGKGKTLYGWHISDLKIYDKPRELSEFRKSGFMTEEEWLFNLYPNTHCHYYAWAKKFEITRPPQSWCYVEELQE